MARLRYTWEAANEYTGKSSEITVEVEYDPAADMVEEIVDCWTTNPHTKKVTPILDVMIDFFALDSIVDRIYWREIYRAQKRHAA